MEVELTSFWFQFMRCYWFGCPEWVDVVVSNKYKTILDEGLNKENPVLKEDILAHIILHDQLSRHIYRGNKEQIALHDIKARQLCDLIKDKLDDYLDPEHRCFALMPCRHTFQKDELEFCLQKVTEWRQVEDCQMYKRFYQATIKALSKINTEADLFYDSALNLNKNNIDILRTILDIKSPNISNDTKLLNINNKIYKQYESNILSYLEEVNTNNTKYLGHPPNNTKDIIISVSGGVDSMVCLYLASHMNKLYPDRKIKAVSINYANRTEQSLEIDMVNKMCEILKIQHYVRTITEIKRTRDSDREFYEQITRDIRFDTYIKVRDTTCSPVILGHNQDDCLENVFSNIKKQKNYNNLFGMEEYTQERDVRILRPLLNVSKAEIIVFANEHNIPYTYDSTPDWSERGKLRDELIPSIKAFDPTLIEGIVQMVNEFKGIYSIYKSSIPKIYYYEKECAIPINEPVCILDYWKKIFTQIALYYKVDFVKNKSIKHFISVLQKKRTINNVNNRITIAKQMVAQIDRGCINIYIYK
jgi:tRNA(Ile)-lysidine synthetase-like protein